MKINSPNLKIFIIASTILGVLLCYIGLYMIFVPFVVLAILLGYRISKNQKKEFHENATHAEQTQNIQTDDTIETIFSDEFDNLSFADLIQESHNIENVNEFINHVKAFFPEHNLIWDFINIILNHEDEITLIGFIQSRCQSDFRHYFSDSLTVYDSIKSCIKEYQTKPNLFADSPDEIIFWLLVFLDIHFSNVKIDFLSTISKLFNNNVEPFFFIKLISLINDTIKSECTKMLPISKSLLKFELSIGMETESYYLISLIDELDINENLHDNPTILEESHVTKYKTEIIQSKFNNAFMNIDYYGFLHEKDKHDFINYLNISEAEYHFYTASHSYPNSLSDLYDGISSLLSCEEGKQRIKEIFSNLYIIWDSNFRKISKMPIEELIILADMFYDGEDFENAHDQVNKFNKNIDYACAIYKMLFDDEELIDDENNKRKIRLLNYLENNRNELKYEIANAGFKTLAEWNNNTNSNNEQSLLLNADLVRYGETTSEQTLSALRKLLFN